jgi:hypothetical protein
MPSLSLRGRLATRLGAALGGRLDHAWLSAYVGTALIGAYVIVLVSVLRGLL